YANIGGLLMTMGLAYDSASGRALCGALTAIMTGVSYATSAEMADELGAFPGYARNAKPMLHVIRNHARAAGVEGGGIGRAGGRGGGAIGGGPGLGEVFTRHQLCDADGEGLHGREDRG